MEEEGEEEQGGEEEEEVYIRPRSVHKSASQYALWTRVPATSGKHCLLRENERKY